jgi:hypothetical protein
LHRRSSHWRRQQRRPRFPVWWPIQTAKNSLFEKGLYSNVTYTGNVASSGNPNPASGPKGTGLNLFADPAAVFNSFRSILLAQDGRHGRNVLRGLRRWSFDWSVQKETNITEKLRFTLGFDFINAFNHPIFNNPTLSLQTPANFGVISSQFENLGGATNGTIGPRRIQVSRRFDF